MHCERRRPEQTTLYRLVQQYAATFFEQASDRSQLELANALQVDMLACDPKIVGVLHGEPTLG